MISEYYEYCYKWGTKINDDKCLVVNFGFNNNSSIKFFINNKEIQKKMEIEYLGFLLK